MTSLPDFDYDHPAQPDHALMVEQPFYALAHHLAGHVHGIALPGILDLLYQARTLALANPAEGEGVV